MRAAIVLVIAMAARGAGRAAAHTPAAPAKHAQAVRVDAGTVVVYGRLTEDVWRTAAPLADVVQKEPEHHYRRKA